jgi:Protein of unknown function (DUF3892)
MADVRITCIQLACPSRQHEFVTHVGNCTGRWPREQVIAWLESGTHSLFVIDAFGRFARVRVVREPGKPPYLRTFVNDTWTDDLLALMECR